MLEYSVYNINIYLINRKLILLVFFNKFIESLQLNNNNNNNNSKPNIFYSVNSI